MNKRIPSKLATLILALTLPVSVFANPYQVISGEHESFTRLVILNASNLKFKIEKRNRSLRVSFDDKDKTFDITKAFDRIGYTRVGSISLNGSELLIEMNCPCSASYFIEANQHIVLDFTDQGHKTIGQRVSDIEQKSLNFEPWIQKPRNDALQQPFSDNSIKLGADVRYALQYRLAKNLADLQTRQILLNQSRSASPNQRLGTGQQPRTAAPIIEREDRGFDIIGGALASKLKSIKPLADEPEENCVSFTTFVSEDGDAEETIYSFMSSAERDKDSALGSDAPILAETGNLLSLGLIHEAKLVLSTVVNSSADKMILGDITEILGSETAALSGIMNNGHFCQQNLTLWRILANEKEQTWLPSDFEAALLEYKALSPALRQLIAPKLIQIVRRSGLRGLEQSVLASADFAFESDKLGFEFLQLEGAISRQDKKSIAEILSAIYQLGSYRTPDELSLLLNAKLLLETPFSASDFSSLEAQIFESKRVPDQEIFQDLKFKGALLAKDFQTASDVAFLNLMPSNIIEWNYLNIFYSSLVDFEKDYTFIEFTASLPSDLFAQLHSETQILIQERLSKLGF